MILIHNTDGSFRLFANSTKDKVNWAQVASGGRVLWLPSKDFAEVQEWPAQAEGNTVTITGEGVVELRDALDAVIKTFEPAELAA